MKGYLGFRGAVIAKVIVNFVCVLRGQLDERVDLKRRQNSSGKIAQEEAVRRICWRRRFESDAGEKHAGA